MSDRPQQYWHLTSALGILNSLQFAPRYIGKPTDSLQFASPNRLTYRKEMFENQSTLFGSPLVVWQRIKNLKQDIKDRSNCAFDVSFA